MGQFSWKDCITEEQIIDNRYKDVFVLVPEKFADKFGGPRIVEHCYDGYGNFGKYDIYNLVAEWNKDMIPEILRRIKNGTWHCSASEDDVAIMNAFFKGEPLPKWRGFAGELRYVGIIMACYDEDNAALEFPIKITYSPTAVYENCEPSLSDPNQGWPPEDEEWEDLESDESSDEEDEPDEDEET